MRKVVPLVLGGWGAVAAKRDKPRPPPKQSVHSQNCHRLPRECPERREIKDRLKKSALQKIFGPKNQPFFAILFLQQRNELSYKLLFLFLTILRKCDETTDQRNDFRNC